MVRNNKWLAQKLDLLWQKYFFDVAKVNKVEIIFGRIARFRFGSITSKKKKWREKPKTLIRITGLFRDSKIPVAVVKYTVAHELVHYAHGFSSPHVKLHRYPHEGGVVNKELAKRGLGKLVLAYKKWLKDYREEVKRHRV